MPEVNSERGEGASLHHPKTSWQQSQKPPMSPTTAVETSSKKRKYILSIAIGLVVSGVLALSLGMTLGRNGNAQDSKPGTSLNGPSRDVPSSPPHSTSLSSQLPTIPENTPSVSPSFSVPSMSLSASSSQKPSILPLEWSAPMSSFQPTSTSTFLPSPAPPSERPSRVSSFQPTSTPTSLPSPAPTTKHPSISPTSSPSNSPSEARKVTTKRGTFEVLEQAPHDILAFTQGLVVVSKGGETGDNTDFTLYEGTGLYGASDIRIVDLPSGTVLQKRRLDDFYFGEGVAYYTTGEGKGLLVQLTWRRQTAFIYDSTNLELLSNFEFSTTNNEGWGITLRHNESSQTFLVSDGSSFLHTWEDVTWNEIRRVQVFEQVLVNDDEIRTLPQYRLNELEWDPVTDTVLANVWQTDRLLRIDPETGFVSVRYDLGALYKDRTSTSDVLNGIACVPNSPDQVWVTGKLWPHMYRIRLIDDIEEGDRI